MTKKETLVSEIAILLELPMPNMSHGSREPQVLFSEALTRLGLKENGLISKQEIAEFVVIISGNSWTPSCWSRGGTITLEGLVKFRNALKLLLNK
jgi:hypothetical protein